ncbi:MAG: hypothetical protein WCG83_00345 [Candidatus Peregrinibacteria bacterium]
MPLRQTDITEASIARQALDDALSEECGLPSYVQLRPSLHVHKIIEDENLEAFIIHFEDWVNHLLSAPFHDRYHNAFHCDKPPSEIASMDLSSLLRYIEDRLHVLLHNGKNDVS